MKALVPILLLCHCTAPVLAPATELAGSQRIATKGTPAESVADKTPFSAWTSAAPLTLVGPGGSNVTIMERFGMRVEVLQIRSGRVRVRCTSCSPPNQNAEGWLPRDVLWVLPAQMPASSPIAKDPLTVLLGLRYRWSAGHDLPPEATPNTMCWLADQGVAVDAGAAVMRAGGGEIFLQRKGADWALSHATAPTETPGWGCDTTTATAG